MSNGKVDINILLDRSGSMYSIVQDTIGGVNSFVKDQATDDDKVRVTLYQFDNQFETVFTNVPARRVEPLNTSTYVPRGSTALLDAIGKAVGDTGRRLKKIRKRDRPSKVLFLIVTDGQENSSREFNRVGIKDMIVHQGEKYNWEFIYIGANVDAFAEAGGLGIAVGNTLNYTADSRGTRAMFASMSSNTKAYSADVNYGPGTFFVNTDDKKDESVVIPSTTNSASK